MCIAHNASRLFYHAWSGGVSADAYHSLCTRLDAIEAGLGAEFHYAANDPVNGLGARPRLGDPFGQFPLPVKHLSEGVGNDRVQAGGRHLLHISIEV